MRLMDHPLTRHLAVAIALKLAVLGGLWWWLVRGQSVDASTEQTAAHLFMPAKASEGPVASAPPTGTPQ